MIDDNLDDDPFGKKSGDPNDEMLTFEDMDKVDEKFRVPKGFWEARIVSAVRNTAKSSGNPKMELTFAFTGASATHKGARSFSAMDERQSGKELTGHYAFTRAAAFKINELAKSLDIEMVGGTISFRPSDLIGKMVMVETEDREYEGRMTTNIAHTWRHPDGPDA